MTQLRRKENRKRKRVISDEHDWLGHIGHLAIGMRYSKHCPVCGITAYMRVGSDKNSRDINADAAFYRMANRSGKQSISF